MTIKITIPNTSSDTLTFGSNNTPTAAQIAGIDSGSSNGQLAIYTTASGTSTERVRVDSAGNVGIGTSSPSTKADVSGITRSFGYSISGTGVTGGTTLFSAGTISTDTNWGMYFRTPTGSSGVAEYSFRNSADTERMRIDSSGNVLVGCTSAPSTTVAGSGFVVESVGRKSLYLASNYTGATTDLIYLVNPNGIQGKAGTNSTGSYWSTSSDYRLKEDIQPMQNALNKVALLKPCTYTWKSTGETGQGFIAHELQEIVPEAVIGEKDAVDADGNPDYQGIDTSFLVATLTAAIQEQQALITALTARIEALEKK